MKYLEEVKQIILSRDGKPGILPIAYLWGTEEGLAPLPIDWQAYPKQIHGKLLETLKEQSEIPDPTVMYVLMEVRSAPLNMPKEKGDMFHKELKEYHKEHGTFEGFPGIKDYAMILGYDGKEFVTVSYEISIDAKDLRKFGDIVHEAHSQNLSGIFADNLKSVFPEEVGEYI